MYSTVLSMSARKETIEVDMVRHIALNILRSLRTKFKNEYGQIVIAVDSVSYWRRDYFPYYKARRKQKREESGLDWTNIFSCMNEVKSELKDFMPYKYVEVEGAEADDIIATLVQTFAGASEPILIVSGDRDFVQLQKYENVFQYDPVKKRFNTTDTPEAVLKEHIIRGDSNDGIPNILSPDNSLITRTKQKRITEKVISEFMDTNFFATIDSDPDNPHYRNYLRNRTLIDLSKIPADIRHKILDCFESSKPDRSKLMKYFMAKKLKQQMANLNEF